MHRSPIFLILVVILLAGVIYTDLPGTTYSIGTFQRSGIPLGLDLRGGLRVLLAADLPAGSSATTQQMDDARAILEKRSNALGVSEVTFQVAGSNRIVGEFPGLTNTDQVIAVLKQVGQLAFVPMGSTRLPEGQTIQVDYSAVTAAATGTTTPGTELTATTLPSLTPTTAATATTTATLAPAGTLTAQAAATAAVTATPVSTPQTTPAATETAAAQVYPAIMTGARLKTVNVTQDTLGKYEISFSLDAEGTKIFKDFTAAHQGEYLAIVLDGVIISDPSINAVIDGSGVIQGSFTYESANNLAIQMRYGSLPVPLKVLQSESVGATLGQDSVRKSVVAGIIGLTVVILFMALYYRLPGILADVALMIYALITFAIFKLLPVTLTLPGIAGFVLSVGVAVDANILIFERLKEELRAGRTLNQAIDLAWKRAWPSIRDSNISTIITCVILFWFGSNFGASLVKGFSVTLVLGVLVSLFTAIVVTRSLLHLVLDNLNIGERLKWFGI
jgi:preprotein translocase subunit SecD